MKNAGMKLFRNVFALILSMVIIIGTNTQCYAASASTQALLESTITRTHSVYISGYGRVNVSVTWSYADGTSASFVKYNGSTYTGTHDYVDSHSSYGYVTATGDMCKYSFGVVFDDEASYLITVYCDIYGDIGQYYAPLPSVGRVTGLK